MDARTEAPRPDAGALIRDGVVVAFLLLLAFSAVDDITTDNDTDFTLEYRLLVVCWLGLLAVAGGLWRRGHRAVAAVSFAALSAALWGSQAIRPGVVPGLWPEYVVVVMGFFWFGALSMLLLRQGWRAAAVNGSAAARPEQVEGAALRHGGPHG